MEKIRKKGQAWKKIVKREKVVIRKKDRPGEKGRKEGHAWRNRVGSWNQGRTERYPWKKEHCRKEGQA